MLPEEQQAVVRREQFLQRIRKQVEESKQRMIAQLDAMVADGEITEQTTVAELYKMFGWHGDP